jgi:DNA-binding response OmpR family regulator
MKKILLIEDEAAISKTLSDVLEQEKYEVIAVLDGETGLRMAQEQSPDIILLDLVLPKHSYYYINKP